MRPLIEFHRLAAAELFQAERWYRARAARAADQFVLQIESTLARIAENPESLPDISRGYRRCPVRRFPYQLIFRIIDRSTVRIFAVAHSRRRPEYWRRRE